MGAKLTVGIVFALIVAAGVAIWMKAPGWDDFAARLDGAQAELAEQMQAELGAAVAPEQVAAELERVSVTAEDEVEDGSYSLVELFTEDDREAALAGRRVLYQFSDDQGKVHFVERFEQVPAAYRDRIGRIEMGGREEAARKTASRSQRRNKMASWRQQPARRGVGTQPEVVVYMAEWCGACKATMKHLDGKGVEYVTKDVDRDHQAAREIMQRLGGSSLSLPTVDVEGEIIQGHQPQRLDRLIGV